MSVTNTDLKILAQHFGGKFYGPNIEHLKISEENFFELSKAIYQLALEHCKQGAKPLATLETYWGSDTGWQYNLKLNPSLEIDSFCEEFEKHGKVDLYPSNLLNSDEKPWQHIPDADPYKRLTDEKAQHIIERDGMQVCGYVLQKSEAMCVVYSHAVRWVHNSELFNFMHGATPQPSTDVSELVSALQMVISADDFCSEPTVNDEHKQAKADAHEEAHLNAKALIAKHTVK